ncbi:MAG TPA: hypothetical protein VFX06_11535 [Stellaceae bacterium]|nr:hypothetical protein [Stellaceae bacterium]
MLDAYVRNGIHTINEARAALGFDPIAGGDRAMVRGTARKSFGVTPWRKANFNPGQPRIPTGSPDGGRSEIPAAQDGLIHVPQVRE